MARYSSRVDRKLSFDLLYVYNYSLFLDLKVLFQTIRVVLQRDQASGLEFNDADTPRWSNFSRPSVASERQSHPYVPEFADLEQNVSSGLD